MGIAVPGTTFLDACVSLSYVDGRQSSRRIFPSSLCSEGQVLAGNPAEVLSGPGGSGFRVKTGFPQSQAVPSETPFALR